MSLDVSCLYCIVLSCNLCLKLVYCSLWIMIFLFQDISFPLAYVTWMLYNLHICKVVGSVVLLLWECSGKAGDKVWHNVLRSDRIAWHFRNMIFYWHCSAWTKKYWSSKFVISNFHSSPNLRAWSRWLESLFLYQKHF